MKPKYLYLIPALVLLALTAGCSSGGDRIEGVPIIEGAPAWVNEGTRAYENGALRLVRGVGTAQPLAERSQQKDNADNRARAEVLRLTFSYLEILAEDYATQNPGIDLQALRQQINTSHRTLLRNTRIIGNWRHQADGRLYALAEMNMDAVQSMVRTSETLDAGFRQFVIENGELVFKQVKDRIR